MAPTCGPVVAAAVIMPPNGRKIPGVRDSKMLSAVQRERLDPIIRARAIAVGVGAASVAEIDRLNIYHATHLAMRRAIARLGGHEHVLVDGNRIVGFEAHVGPYTSIVDGDATCYSIACASIVAKVVRDRLMTRLAMRYPGYGWEHNAGYATPDHRAALFELGPTPFHRRSFASVQAALHGLQLGFDLDDDPTRDPSDDSAAGDPPRRPRRCDGGGLGRVDPQDRRGRCDRRGRRRLGTGSTGGARGAPPARPPRRGRRAR